jgi:hypothetical protein
MERKVFIDFRLRREYWPSPNLRSPDLILADSPSDVGLFSFFTQCWSSSFMGRCCIIDLHSVHLLVLSCRCSAE